MSKIIYLQMNIINKFSYRNIDGVEPFEIRQKLLCKGYKRIVLKSVPLKKSLYDIPLWVEVDVDFLIEACQFLEELIITNQSFEHHSFLNDGLLTIATFVDKEIAKINYKYYPGLNKNNLILGIQEISKENYLWLWRNIVYQLLDIAK